jgi:hypothetical protein
MNKMGGILDYNIVIGLCMNTVKTSSVCEEHLKVAAAEWREEKDTTSWDTDTVRAGWLGSNTTKINKNANDVVIACAVTPEEASSKEDCIAYAQAEPINGGCEGVMDEDGCLYTQPVMQSQAEYVLENAGKTLFQELLADVEKEAQAKYNAKLTKEQNVCLANNNGGIMGSSENGSTFMWVKLKTNKIPKNYTQKGLTANQFTASNDLYGSFCRARVTVMSDDKDIQDALGKDSVAYFAVGDTFTCGSWISSKTLEKISQTVGERELCKQGYGKWVDGKCDGSKLSTKEKIAYAWGTVAPALAGGAIGTGLTESGTIANWLNSADEKNKGTLTQKQRKKLCISYAENAYSAAAAAAAAAVEAAAAEKSTGENSEEKKAKTTTEFQIKEQAARTALNNAVDACDNVVANWSTKDKAGKPKSCGTAPGDSKAEYTDAAKIGGWQTQATDIKGICEEAADKSPKDNTAARIAIPIATTLAGGALGAGITASVIQQKKENIKNEAAQKWMEEVGDHIECYVGVDSLGTYGDAVAIEID